MSFQGDRGPVISKENIEYYDFMQIKGGRLYTINITGMCYVIYSWFEMDLTHHLTNQASHCDNLVRNIDATYKYISMLVNQQDP